MKRNLALIVCAAIAFFVSGCAKEGAKVLAKINDTVITVEEFNKKIERLPEHYQDIIKNQQKKFLDEIVREELLYQEALRLKIDRDQEAQEIISEAKRKILVSRLVNDKVSANVAVSDEELKQYYDEHSEEFMLPERWRASHILVETEEEAQEIKNRLDSGEVFEIVAQEKSKDATAKQGGDVGYFSKGQLIPEFEEASFALEIGQLSGIVKTQFGYHIIKLTDRKSPEVQGFDDVKDLIKKEQEREQQKEVFEALMSDLNQRANILIHEELLTVAPEEPAAAE